MDLQHFLGETSSYDKKRSLEKNKPKSWLKSVSAFANGSSGRLIFGIDEGDEIVGLMDYKGNSEFISERIKTKLEPIPDFEMEIETIEDKVILVLTFSWRKYTLLLCGQRF